METLTGVLIALAVLACTSGANAGGSHDNRSRALGCAATAKDMLRSCRSEAYADYSRALANARNLASAAERKEAAMEAKAELREALEECAEQREARLDLCSALGEDIYDPEIDPENFDEPLDNPYFPLTTGITRVYENEDGSERVEVTVTDETYEILGVECVVVVDVEYEDDEVVEETRDYFAADNFGNVWYFGEHSLEVEDGIIVGSGGSWIAGEDGAKPGIIMPVAPTPGFVYRQEWFLGEAEDAGEILSTMEDVTVPYGMFSNCVQTADFTPLEPGNLEHKFYAAGTGLLKELDVNSGDEIVLIDVTAAP